MRAARGMTVVEVLIALSLTLGAGFAFLQIVGGGVRAAAGASARWAAAAAVVETLEALDAEAHRSAAIFTPARDVFGGVNCDATGACAEVDFYTRDPAGSPRFRAYRFDAMARVLRRIDYASRDAAGSAVGVKAGESAAGTVAAIETFRATTRKASQLRVPVLGTYAVRDVAIPLGFPEAGGGNAVVAVTLGNAALQVEHHLLPRMSASGFVVVTGTFTPGPDATAAPSAPPGRTTPGIARRYVSMVMWRIGPCVNVPPSTPGCGPNGIADNNLREQNGADTGPGGTLVAPFDSTIASAPDCASAATIAGARDARNVPYAAVGLNGISETWSFDDGSGAYAVPSGILAPSGPGDSNPLAPTYSNGPGWSYVTTYRLTC